MSLTARITSNSLGNISILLEGELEIESCIILKKQLSHLAKTSQASTLTLDFHRLEFVGASGIGHLVEIVQMLITCHPQVKMSNLRIEFIRVFKLYNFDPTAYLVEDFILENEAEAPVKFSRKTQEI